MYGGLLSSAAQWETDEQGIKGAVAPCDANDSDLVMQSDQSTDAMSRVGKTKGKGAERTR